MRAVSLANIRYASIQFRTLLGRLHILCELTICSVLLRNACCLFAKLAFADCFPQIATAGINACKLVDDQFRLSALDSYVRSRCVVVHFCLRDQSDSRCGQKIRLKNRRENLRNGTTHRAATTLLNPLAFVDRPFEALVAISMMVSRALRPPIETVRRPISR